MERYFDIGLASNRVTYLSDSFQLYWTLRERLTQNSDKMLERPALSIWPLCQHDDDTEKPRSH
jgi:hypothetical protein